MARIHTFALKQLFIPEKFDAYFSWRQRIVGVEIGEKVMYATVVSAKGLERTVEQFVEEPIPDLSAIVEIEKSEKQPEQVVPDMRFNALVQTLKNLSRKIGSVDKIYCVISTSQIVVKEQVFPFDDEEKIAKVLPFEIESQLPFALGEAVISFIKPQPNTGVVAITKQTVVDYYVRLFEQAGLKLDKLSVDSFELFAFLDKIGAIFIPTAQEQHAAQALLYLSPTTTFFMLIDQHKPIAIKPIPALINQAGVVEKNVQAASVAIFSALKRAQLSSIQTCYVAGLYADDQDRVADLGKLLGISLSPLHPAVIFKNSTIKRRTGNGLSSALTTSLALALDLEVTSSFNLLDRAVIERSDRLLTKQLIAAGVLLGLFFLALLGHTFFQQYTFRKAIDAIEADSIKKLKTVFELPPSKSKKITLRGVKDEARAVLTKEQSIWFALAPNNRNSFLWYLQELSSRINRRELGLELKRISLQTTEDPDRDQLTIEGSVRGYDPELRQFEETLAQMPMIIEKPRFEDPKFTEILMLNKKYRETS